jgi:hypothetical protein
MVMFLKITLLLIGSLFVPSHALAQGGRVRYMEIGVSLDTPADYDAMPIPRTEKILKLLYVRRDEEARGSTNLGLYRLPCEPQAASTLEGFLGSTLKVKASDVAKGAKSLGKFKRQLIPYQRGERLGMVYSYTGTEHVFFLVGETPGETFDREVRNWDRLAGELRFHTPAKDDRRRSELARKYGRTRLSDKERRIFANLSMVEGWSAFDSEQYIYLVHGEDTQAWKEFDGHLTGVRRFLTEHLLTHRNLAPQDVGVVRLCRDRQEYLDYGGMDWTAGYFSAAQDQLVIYDDGDKQAMLSVLRHESFHQYINAALGGISPHIWFDEGYAELMFSAKLDQQRVVGFEPLTHHLSTLSSMLGEQGKGLEPLDVFLHLSQKQFYSAPREYYAQAWIWLEFLVNSEYGQRSSRGEDFLKRYVRYVRDDWQALVDAVPAGAPLHSSALTEVREAALTKALKRFDLKDAEPAFLRYVIERIAE